MKSFREYINLIETAQHPGLGEGTSHHVRMVMNLAADLMKQHGFRAVGQLGADDLKQIAQKTDATLHDVCIILNIDHADTQTTEGYFPGAPDVAMPAQKFSSPQIAKLTKEYNDLHSVIHSLVDRAHAGDTKAQQKIDQCDARIAVVKKALAGLGVATEGVAEGFTDTLKSVWRGLKAQVVDIVANAVGLPDDQRREVFVQAGNEFSNEVIKLLANHPARDKLIPMVREIGGYMAKARTVEELKSLMDKAGLFLADVEAGKFNPLSGVAKTLPSYRDKQDMAEESLDEAGTPDAVRRIEQLVQYK